MSVAGGLGGGPLYVPLMIIILNFSPFEAVPLSKSMVLGTAAGAVAFNVFKSYPGQPRRPLINYHAAALLEPPTIMGAMVGVFINVILPSWVIVVALLVVITFSTLDVGRKAYLCYLKEKGSYVEMDDDIVVDRTGSGYHDIQGEVPQKPIPRASTALLQHAPRPRISMPWVSFAQPFISWLLIAASGALRGGGSWRGLANLEACTWQYWLAIGTPLFLIVVQTFWWSWYANKRGLLPAMIDGPRAGQPRWSGLSVIVPSSICFFGGLIAGGMGLGAAMVKGPLLIALGLDPREVSATCSFMILLTAMSTTIQFMFLGRLPYTYFAFFFALTLATSVIGKLLVTRAVTYYRKTFFIIGFMALMFGIGAIAVSYITFDEILAEARLGKNGGLLLFGSVCGGADGGGGAHDG